MNKHIKYVIVAMPKQDFCIQYLPVYEIPGKHEVSVLP